MERSSNTFEKQLTAGGLVPVSSNSAQTVSLSVSSNPVSNNRDNTFLDRGVSKIEGDNITSGAYGFDDIYSGTPFGADGEPYGGLQHFAALD